MQKNFQRNTKFEGVVLCLVGNKKVKDEQAEGTREMCWIETKHWARQDADEHLPIISQFYAFSLLIPIPVAGVM